MRIAQVAPLLLPVPPFRYGGIERVVSFLTEELLHRGHEVTLFASGDSVTGARLESCCAKGLGLDVDEHASAVAHFGMLQTVWRRRYEFDLIHFHTDCIHFKLFKDQSVPFLSTIHMPPREEWNSLFNQETIAPLVAVSQQQSVSLNSAKNVTVIDNGIPTDLFHCQTVVKRPYLAFLGSISPEKGTHLAIAVAKSCGMPLKMASRTIEPRHQEYFRQRIRPEIGRNGIEWLGEISDIEKQHFLAHALALLVPVAFPEPFGLVMIEAMACGTPVVGFNRGSVPEVVEHGVTGFVVQNALDAAEAVSRLPELSSTMIRARFEDRFTATRMTQKYLALYQRMLRPTSLLV